MTSGVDLIGVGAVRRLRGVRITRTSTTEILHASLLGIYDNETTFEIAMRDVRLVVVAGGAVGEVRQGSDACFRSRSAAGVEHPVTRRRSTLSRPAAGRRGTFASAAASGCVGHRSQSLVSAVPSL